KNSVTAFVYGPDSKMKHCEEFRYSPHADIAAPDRATFVKQVAASAAIGEVKRNKSLANMNDVRIYSLFTIWTLLDSLASTE
ncbi:hypothetical protein C0991_009488, partial [Blastosporella zonata]